jgi:hypothetical protein
METGIEFFMMRNRISIGYREGDNAVVFQSKTQSNSFNFKENEARNVACANDGALGDFLFRY